MKKKTVLLIAAGAGILCAAAVITLILIMMNRQKKTGPATGYLCAEGKTLYDGEGQPILLQGVNLGNYFVQEFWMSATEATDRVRCQKELEEILIERFGEEKAGVLLNTYLDHFITEADFDFIQGLGFNCIRVPFWYGTLTDDLGNFKADAFSRLDWVVSQAQAQGLYVILDLHGAYGSQNGSDHSGIDGGEDKKNASAFFFGDQAAMNQELTYKLWEEIAAHYKGNPTIAGYDLLNEPFCTWRYNSGMSDQELHDLLYPVYDTAYQRIRAVDPLHLIIMEAVWDATDLPSPKEYGWTNVMYEYHQYEYSNYWNENNTQVKSFERKIKNIRSKNHDVPSYMGEFTLFNDMEAWMEGLRLLNEADISWTFWSYKCMKDNDNWGIMRLAVSKVNPETDSYEEIIRKWSNLDKARENYPLMKAIRSGGLE